ncbi:MAG: DUF1643 domain-containing protein [Candidatus Sulfotelmatobacter sp.]|jgi:hypothetical protein
MAGTRQEHDPGGKVRRAISRDVKSSALFGGPNKCYRYQLKRTWDETKPHAMFIMMNPSTADLKVNDPSVAKCEQFARTWRAYGGILVANTFAYRHTYQKRLIEDVSYLIGPDNDRHIIEMTKDAGIVVFAYGKPRRKALRARGKELALLLVEKAHINPHALGFCKDGTPKHPLYLKKDSRPVPWKL